MKRALTLAMKGQGFVHPNPLVGAVLVKNNKIIGEGAHERFGGPHAEVNAIRRAAQSPAGATLYITLEPCAHTGKTPPCTDLILKSGIKRVVAGANDPNPLVSGKGLRILSKKGVKVTAGIMRKEAEALNKDFNHWIRAKTPYVVAKTAQSLDGKIATKSGQSQWITGPEARRYGQRLRAACDAILVGVNTILRDDPLLSVRQGKGAPQPLKIVLDSRLKTPPRARIFSKESPGNVILAVTRKAPRNKGRLFRGKAEILVVKEKGGKVDFTALLKSLGKRGVVSVLIEGGGEVIGEAFSSKVVNEVYFFIAPKIIGGRTAIPSVGGAGVSSLKDAAAIWNLEVRPVGKDLLAHGVLY